MTKYSIHTRAVVSLVIFSLAANHAAGEDVISFNDDIRPILSDKCFHCHGPDADNQDSEFRLDTREHALADLGGYAGIVPGEPDDSELLVRLHSDDEDTVMPPPDALRQLTDDEKELLEIWIAEGAAFDSHWAFKPIPAEVAVPEVNNDWTKNEIDRFVITAMAERGLASNPAADKNKWLRRVRFDLTGLPPTVEEVEAYLADESDDANAKVVERLLASVACAERLASEWLDVARYSDSYGYQRDDPRLVWPYRDWVINAFHENKPYDVFVREQLAGDLLDNPTRDQILATTFNRLHSHKKEGGVAIEEFRVENVADRTHTFAGALLGLTMECARCHDHKYDPTKTKEYYQLSSFFANVDERGLISYFTDAVPTPAMPLPTPDQETQLAAASEAIEEAEAALADAIAGSQDRYEYWLTNDKPEQLVPGLVAKLSFEAFGEVPKENAKSEMDKDVAPESLASIKNQVEGVADAITPIENRLVDGKSGKGIQLTGDDAVVLPGTGHFKRHDPFSISIWIKTPELEDRSVIFRRSRGWDDAGSVGYELTRLDGRLTARLCHFWPGNAIDVETEDVLLKDTWQHLCVTYDGSSKAAGLKIYVDGKFASTIIRKDHLTRNISDWRNGYYDLAIGSRYRDRGMVDALADEFQVFDRELSSLEVQHLHDPETLGKLGTSKTSRDDVLSDAQWQTYYQLAFDPQVAKARKELHEARKAYNDLFDQADAITIMRETPEPKEAFVLKRGVYDSHGEPVTADTPAFLPPFPDGAPRNRLGLADWVMSDDHPLTARVTVNRYWQMLFGNGLVRTPEDFGMQGETPTHPELLDWLSRDFIANGWDVRRLLRMIVLSSTYGQSAIVDPAKRDLDPENRWLARGPSQRLSAEMIRDNALAVSELLDQKVGGEPVHPYDLALAYTPLPVDDGNKLYRRSLYTFWKRTSPAPLMMTLNAGAREVCRVKREVTASPLQALVLLNGPQFIEASRVLSEKLIGKHGDVVDAIIDEAFLRLISRVPTDAEREILTKLYEEQKADFDSDVDRAEALLGVGAATVSGDIEAARLAATTILVSSIMNLNESVRHQ